jgi:hypothetical protein
MVMTLAGLAGATESPARFLTLPPSPVYSALGVHGTAAIDDATSLFSNPGGLGRARFGEIAATHSELFSDSTFDSLAVSRPLRGDRGALALGVLYLRKGAIEGRDDTGASTGGFMADDLAVNLGYGRSLGARLAVGSNFKFVRQRIDRYSASAVAVDVGAQLAATERLRLGASLNNLGTRERFVSERESLPLSTNVGLTYTLHALDFTVESDTLVNEHRTRLGLGVGAAIGRALDLRGGYSIARHAAGAGPASTRSSIGNLAGFSAGLGFTIGRFQLDYALVPHEELAPSHEFDLRMRY